MPPVQRSWPRVIARVCIDYRRVHGRLPALFAPRRYTEKVQWRKLFELEPIFAVISDKLAARDFVAARIGPGHQAPLLWAGDNPDAIPFDRLTAPYVVKSTHAAGHSVIVRDPVTLDQQALREIARGWLNHCHGTAVCEPAYLPLPHRLIVEELLVDRSGAPPVEQRVFVFNGRAELVQTTIKRPDGVLRAAAYHTRDWVRLPIQLLSAPDPIPPPRPKLLDRMLDLAERIGAGLSHCRVDCYDCGDRLRVGEVTLYSWSGLMPFKDPAYDLMLGAYWTIRRPALRALRTMATGRWGIWRTQPLPPAVSAPARERACGSTSVTGSHGMARAGEPSTNA
jgi:hypothetical protein